MFFGFELVRSKACAAAWANADADLRGFDMTSNISGAHMKLNKKWFVGSCLAGFVAMVAVGCSQLNRKPGRVEIVSDSTAHVLAAARASKINMFGDLGDFNNETYVTRNAISVKQHTFSDVGADFDPTIDYAGKRMAFSSTRHNQNPDIYVKAVDGVAVTQLSSDPSSDVQPAFSPDGTKIAFASDRTGNWDIWMISESGGQPVQVTRTPADEIHPSWSHDGKQIVYCSLPASGGQWELWIADVSGGSSRKFIGYGLFPEWSPVDNRILYQRARERGSQLFSVWMISLENGEPSYPTELAFSGEYAFTLPTWSPNGREVAMTSVSESGAMLHGQLSGIASDVWLMAGDGRGKMRLTDGHSTNYAPTFAPDGRIFFTANRDGTESIWSLRPSGPGYGSGDNVQFTAGPNRPITTNAVPVSSKN